MFDNILELAPFLWLAILVLSALVEIGTVSLVAIWFMPAALVAVILSLFSVPFWIQALCFFALSAAFLIFVMPTLRKKLKARIVPTNVDGLIGCEALVLEEVDNLKRTGLVSVKGQSWSASSRSGQNIPKGEKVTVVGIEGVRAICEIKEENL